MKKGLALAILLSIGAVSFAQQNTISVGAGLFSLEASYERHISENFSVLLYGVFNSYIIGDEYGVALKARAYPFGGTFFVEIGAGYGDMIGIVGGSTNLFITLLTFGLLGDISNQLRVQGVLFTPGLGWQIDFGEPGGIVLPIRLGIDIVAGNGFDCTPPYLRVGLGLSF